MHGLEVNPEGVHGWSATAPLPVGTRLVVIELRSGPLLGKANEYRHCFILLTGTC